MSTYAYRFVGQESLPSRLSDFDLERFFQLTKNDIEELGAQFRTDHRAPAALIVLFLRAAGRPLDRFALLPRNLLRYVGETFKTAAPTIASLRAIYKRSRRSTSTNCGRRTISVSETSIRTLKSN